MKLKATLGAASLLSTLAVSAFAQTFPEGPITWVVNWPAGGGQDTTSRMVADHLSGALGVPVVIENYDGAGGLTGMRELAKADADGYTIGMLGASSVIQQYTTDEPVMMDQLDVLSFFGPDPGALTVGAGTAYQTLDDYVSAVKEAPGDVPNGNDPPGGASYISAAIMESALGLELNKVPYAGYAPTVTALLGGEVESATVPLPQVLEHAVSGDVRILGVMSGARHFLAPDIPTFEEQGYDVLAGDFRAIVAPAGLPADVAAILSEALIEVLSAEEFITLANTAGYMIEPLGAEEASARITAFDEQVYPVLEEAGLVTNPK
ncbi:MULTISPECIES: Bug family tripartite tricarboxylate transporter substrate binding protein [Pacificibacter]|uniref:Bug family tripartite tricarboxylate transporter substrate binding protein n=1 Tax=Pacificibacter TaxID=1042323 RepID=UPI001C08E24B|nr:tripartite tricarboxylate transporter substrate binding protein [Pacificibacter sp. 1_MG-2023]MBU2935066.1 tripartite tricarboxylate transporter substrate binding protein [Pacificibacter marinus]MDO6617375.1 tripartite tricarboxylate transporter substrate binding protein [Pacificibacter sp. 1_MG-2023]